MVGIAEPVGSTFSNTGVPKDGTILPRIQTTRQNFAQIVTQFVTPQGNVATNIRLTI